MRSCSRIGRFRRAPRTLAVARLAALVLAGLVIAFAHAAASSPGDWDYPMPVTTQAAPTPVGFIVFCGINEPGASACATASDGPAVVTLTPASQQQLDAVQAYVNATVKPKRAPPNVWDYPVDGEGDCNRYALEKQRELLALGWPRAALLLAVAVTERSEGHLVLIARTDKGELVLDNRVPDVENWQLLPYRWVERQTSENPFLWVSIAAPPQDQLTLPRIALFDRLQSILR